MPSRCPSSSSSSSRLLRSTSKATSSIKKPSSKTPRLFPSIPSLLSKLPGLPSIPSLLARISGLGKTTKEESPRLYPRMFSLLDSAPLDPILEIDVGAPPSSPVSPPPSPVHIDVSDSTDFLCVRTRPSTPDSPASLSSDEDEVDDVDEEDDDPLPFTPVNVRDHSDGIFSATFTQQIANQWDELEELRKQKRTAKTVRETRHEERLFTIARGHNAYALVVPFGDKPMKAPLHEELRFPPTDEQLTAIHSALGRAYQGKFADSLKDLESFERTLHHLQFGGGNSRRSLLETHAYLRAHVSGYGKGRKRTDLEETLAIIRKLRPVPPASPKSDESQSDDSSTDAPWEVQEFRRRSGKKAAAAQIDGSTPWAAPVRRGLRAISLRMKEVEEDTGSTRKRPAKRRKLSFK